MPDIMQGIALLLFFVLVFNGLEYVLDWRPTLGVRRLSLPTQLLPSPMSLSLYGHG